MKNTNTDKKVLKTKHTVIIILLTVILTFLTTLIGIVDLGSTLDDYKSKQEQRTEQVSEEATKSFAVINLDIKTYTSVKPWIWILLVILVIAFIKLFTTIKSENSKFNQAFDEKKIYIEEKRSEINDKDQEITKLKKEITECTEKYNTLVEENTGSYNSKDPEDKPDNSSPEEELQEQKGRINKEDKEQEDFRSFIKEKPILKKEIATLKKNLEGLQRSLKEAEIASSETLTAKIHAEKALSDFKKQLVETEDHSAAIYKLEITSLKEKVETATANTEKKEKRILFLTKNFKELNDRNELTRTALITEKQELKNSLKTKEEKLKANAENIEQKLLLKNNEIVSLQNKNKKLDANLTIATKHAQTFGDDLSTATEEVKTLKEELDIAQKAILSLNTEKVKLVKELESGVEANTEKLNELTTAEDKIQILKSDAEVNDAVIGEALEKIKTLEDKIEDKNIMISGLIKKKKNKKDKKKSKSTKENKS